jgi:hypothetical protein
VGSDAVNLDDLFSGDRISLTFDDIPRDRVTASISRKLSDREEGLGPEIEDYIAYWFEINCEGDTRGEINNVLLLTTGRYWLDGQFVTIRKIP